MTRLASHTKPLTLVLGLAAVLLASSCGSPSHPAASSSAQPATMTGPSVTFGVHSLDGATVTSAQLARTLDVLKLRLKALGVDHPHVQLVDGDRVWVGLAGVTNPSRAATTLAEAGRLMFFDDGATRVAGPKPTIRAALIQAVTQPLLAVSRSGRHALRQLARGGRSLDYGVIKAPAGALNGNRAPAFFVYRLQPSMTGAAVMAAHEATDTAGRPDVLIDFTASGARDFTSLTANLAAVGAAKRSPQTFAIVLDNIMRSDPLLDYRQNPTGIAGDEAEIVGMFTVWQARSLAAVLTAGPLPVRLVQVTPPSRSPSAEPSGMTGSWVPRRGSVVWTASDGTVGYDFGQKAPRPGGLLISKEGVSYKVTLVSRNGLRYPTVTKMDGVKLNVYFGAESHTIGAPFFYLNLTATDILSMYAYDGQWQDAMDFKPGSPSSPRP